MIRLNVFFTLKDEVSLDEVKAITDELVAKSRLDEGNKGYDLYQSTTNSRVMMFCETWESQEALDKHSNMPHFTYAVPKLNDMIVDGLHIESLDC
jgi:quinol monooxygenase YgiN